MESEELSTDRTKVRGSRGELQGTREEHEGEDTSPVKGVASATGSPRVDFGRQGLREALKSTGSGIVMCMSRYWMCRVSTRPYGSG